MGSFKFAADGSTHLKKKKKNVLTCWEHLERIRKNKYLGVCISFSIIANVKTYYGSHFLEWLQHLPEVCLGELLHVKLLICERGQVDIADSWEHFT